MIFENIHYLTDDERNTLLFLTILVGTILYFFSIL